MRSVTGTAPTHTGFFASFFWPMVGWVICLLLATTAVLGAEPGPGGRVVLLRHAERVSLFDQDSPLSPLGVQRAAGLATLLEAFKPTALIASNKLRTQQTLAPLARRVQLPVQIWDAAQAAPLATWLRAHAGKGTLIVCWHHDRMRALAKALGVPEPLPNWSAFTYNNLWIIDLHPDGKATLEVKTQWDGPLPPS